MSVVQRERAALVEILRAVGPDAPTLCEGWTTRDLAAHLVTRERRPDARPGLVIPSLHQWTEQVERARRDSSSYADLVATIHSGPPLPMRLPIVHEAANAAE